MHMQLEIIIIAQCEKELKEFPNEVLKDLIDAIAKLQNGIILSMPLSKSLSGIHKALHELRFKDRTGIYRVIYYMKPEKKIYIIHAFKKKSQKLPMKNIDTTKKRLRILL